MKKNWENLGMRFLRMISFERGSIFEVVGKGRVHMIPFNPESKMKEYILKICESRGDMDLPSLIYTYMGDNLEDCWKQFCRSMSFATEETSSEEFDLWLSTKGF